MFNVPSFFGFKAGSEFIPDADYQAVLNYAITQGYTLPSASQQVLQNQLVLDLKTAGVWSKLDIFYVFATDGDSDFASINWKDPNNFEITEVNSPNFTPNQGFEGNGTSAYLDTNWNITNDSVNWLQNDAGIFCAFPIMNSTPQSPNTLVGTNISNYVRLRVDENSNSGNNRMWLNSTNRTDNIFDTKVNNTIYFANRTSGTNMSTRNTDLATSTTNSFIFTVASTALPNQNINLFRIGTEYAPSGNKMGILGLGSNFSSLEMDDIENAWYTNYFSNL
jgi:hypothetical protein